MLHLLLLEFRTIWSILVHFWSILVHSVHLGGAFGQEVCVERWVVLLKIMLLSKYNVSMFLIKFLFFSYVIKVFFFFFLSEKFTYIYFLLRPFKTYRRWTIFKGDALGLKVCTLQYLQKILVLNNNWIKMHYVSFKKKNLRLLKHFQITNIGNLI